mmetsp:Transcript_18071/g.30835  ORF Transcript_18071/g.30835 Transcript_18071/m.30835 type:complete len:155 (-) Transcript_18071:903-1367(-)
MLIFESSPNEINLICYFGDLRNPEHLLKTKNFRKFNQIVNQGGSVKVLIVTDPKVASQMNMDSSEKGVGSVYILKRRTAVSDLLGQSSNANLLGRDYICTRVFSGNQLKKEDAIQGLAKKIALKLFEQPIITPPHMIPMYYQGKGALIVYADPN